MSAVKPTAERMRELQEIVEKDRDLAAMGYFTHEYSRARVELEELRAYAKLLRGEK